MIKSRAERRRIQKENQKKEKKARNEKRNVNLKQKLIMAGIGLSTIASLIYFGSRVHTNANQHDNHIVKQGNSLSINLTTPLALIHEKDSILKDSRSSGLEKMIVTLKASSAAYNGFLIQSRPTQDMAFEVFKQVFFGTSNEIRTLNPEFNQFVYEQFNNSGELRLVLKKYFMTKGYFFDMADMLDRPGVYYKSIFLVKIASEEKRTIPLFDTDKKISFRLLKYGTPIIKNASQLSIENEKGEYYSYSFRTSEDTGFAIIDTETVAKSPEKTYTCALQHNCISKKKHRDLAKQGKRKEFIEQYIRDNLENTAVHEGTHVYLSDFAIFKTEEERKKYTETLAVLNEIMNGADPFPPIENFCRMQSLHEYDNAKNVICPFYENADNMTEQQARKEAKLIFDNNFQWLKDRMR